MTPEQFSALRVGDLVVWPTTGELGRVEEVTSATLLSVRWEQGGLIRLPLGGNTRPEVGVVDRALVMRRLAA